MKERREGDDFRFTHGAVELVLGSVRESSGDLTAVVRGYHLNGRGPVPLIAPSRLNLVAPRSRAELAKTLSGRGAVPDMDVTEWVDLVEQVCGRTYVLWERGEPFVDLVTAELPNWDRRELFKGFMPRNDPMTLFSDGGVGKSTVSAALSLSCLTGKEVIPGIPPLDQGPVLYLDWESNKGEHGHRLHTLARHLGLTLPEGFIYRRNFRALGDDIGTLRREAARLKPVLCIVDSAVPASGDDIKETGAPRGLFSGLRAMGDDLASLLLAHMSKAEAEKEQGRSRVMGSVMFENLSRSVWEGRPSEHANGEHIIGLFHRKFNGGRKRSPFALRIRYDADELPMGFDQVDIRDYSDLADRLPTYDRLHELLRAGPKTTKEIAEDLDKPQRAVLKFLKRQESIQQVRTGGGPGNPALWGLKANEDRWWAE